MRLLLDECVPRHLRRELSDHEARTVPEMGWAAKENGELLQLAGESFDVFITVDQRLSYQQEVARFSIAVVVLGRNEIRSTSYFIWCLNCDECWQTFSQGKCIGSVSNDRLEKAVRLARFARMPSLLSLRVSHPRRVSWQRHYQCYRPTEMWGLFLSASWQPSSRMPSRTSSCMTPSVSRPLAIGH